MPLVLASASPRRHELLKDAGVEFTVSPANLPEIRHLGEAPKAFAERMAREKARTIFNAIKDQPVLGADTVVTIAAEVSPASEERLLPLEKRVTGVSPLNNDLVLGKPESNEDALRILRLLSGRKHQVITGVCLIANDFEDVRSETTSVYFSELSDAVIREYIATGEPMDKAGAYAIQGGASHWVSKIEGDYSNVVGLPIAIVLQMLRDHGVGGS